MRGARTAVAATVLLAAGTAAFGHVRLRNPDNGSKLRWSNPGSIHVVISSAGSDDIAAGLHFPAIRGAIDAWNAASGSVARLAEDRSPAQQDRTDWQADGLHQVLFDESNDSGYFPVGTGIVAITPVWYAGDGHITDADVLFNGAGFGFTTSGQAGHFDVQDVAAHELGHLLGLDHSGWAGATMYPYVDPTVILHRSLSLDDELGMRDAYPAASFAAIRGTIRRAADDTVVPGAQVVARGADGRTAAGAVAGNSGGFELRGLEPGTYRLYATPLDFPVSAANLDGGHAVEVDFESTHFGGFAVAAGQTLAVGSLCVGPDVPISLGRAVDRYPLRCITGRTRAYTVRGSGLAAGSTLAASDPALAVTATAWFGSAVAFEVAVPAEAAAGHADLTATDLSGNRSILVAALEITPPDPGVAGVLPASGDPFGGTALTVLGSGFAAGARVVIGDVAYADGQAGGCTVVDPGTIQLVTSATAGGLHDVVVIDASGVEGRLEDAFLVATTPRIDSTFPAAGSALGGTSVVLRGDQFVKGCTVRIAGVVQGQVFVDDSTRLSFVTAPGTAGGPYVLEVLNPGGATATSTFAYAAAADPSIAEVAPVRGSSSGGDTVTILGAGFAPGMEVVFGADADTGAGGAAVTATWIDAGTLEVTTPAHARGAASVLVRDPASGQASVVADAFTFVSSGGGGGCSVASIDAPPEPLAGAGWLLALALIVLARASRGARAARA